MKSNPSENRFHFRFHKDIDTVNMGRQDLDQIVIIKSETRPMGGSFKETLEKILFAQTVTQ